MKDLGKLASLFGLNVILAFLAAPEEVAADECNPCWDYYMFDCVSGGTGFGHSFWSADMCPEGEERGGGGQYTGYHGMVYDGTCGDAHTHC